MIKLVSLLKELNEAKQVGDIYHFTDTDTIASMTKDGGGIVLDPSFSSFAADKYYSFTRNPNLNTLSPEKHHVRLKLDGDAMSNKYKFEPYADIESGEDLFSKNAPNFESEERINSKKYGKIDLTPYIEEITVIGPDDFKEYLDSYHSGTKYYDTILKDYNTVLDWVKSKNIPLTFSKGGSAASIRRARR
jgi:hypothetical protein